MTYVHSALAVLVLAVLGLLGFDAEGGMGHGTKAFFRYEFARDAAHAVGFVFDTAKGGLQALDELLLAGGHRSEFFLGLGHGALFEHFVGWHRVVYVVATATGERVHHLLVVTTCQFHFFQNNLAELLQFLIGITCLFCHDAENVKDIG